MESLISNGSAFLPNSPNGKDVATPEESNPLSPPFWKTDFQDEPAASVERRNVRSQIRLEDHTEESSEQFKALWAKSVRIDDYIIIRGAAGFGAYVVWNCTVDILDVSGLLLALRTTWPPNYWSDEVRELVLILRCSMLEVHKMLELLSLHISFKII
jgi:hypothetical protein